MGMYDNLRINRQMLPISDDVRKRIKSDEQWQTKDFECILSMAEIKDDGTLWFRYARNVWDENVKTGVYDITGKMGGLVEVDVKWVQLEDYFGYIYFYTTIEREWYEFCAKFDDGKLLSIVRVE